MSPADFLLATRIVDGPTFMVTVKGDIVAANPAARKLMGVGLNRLQSKKIQDLICSTEHGKLKRNLRNWSSSRNPTPAVLKLSGQNDEHIEYRCQGYLLQPATVDMPVLIALNAKPKTQYTNQFGALNNKINQLQKEIRERNRVEKSLSDSEKQVRLLLDATGEAIYGIDIQARCTFVNTTCVNVLGYKCSEELLGQDIHKLIQHSYSNGDPYPFETSPIYHSLMKGSQVHRDDQIFHRKDNSMFPVEYKAHPIGDEGKVTGVVVTFRDISQRREIEEELSRSQETLERAQAIAHVGSWDWDIVSGKLHWTDEIYRIFGLQPQEFGATYEAFLKYIHPDDQDKVIDAVTRSISDDKVPYSIEHRVIQPDGGGRIVSERGKVYRDVKGNPIRMIGTVQDITEKKLAEKEIRKLNVELERRVERRTAELQAANKQLESSLLQLQEAQAQLVQSEKMASLGGLVAGVAHEINTPVGVGVTAISHLEMKLQEYLLRYESGQLTREDFEVLLEVATESSHIVHQNLGRAAELIKSFKQVAVDQVTDEMRDFDLKEYLLEVMQSLKPRLNEGDHKFEIYCPNNIELNSHPGALSQVIANLVMNSTIHGFDNRKCGNIKISVAQTVPDKVSLEYSDDGQGMNSEVLKSIFEPFFTTRRGRGGTGLGMHIVYNLVTQTLGGYIECHSVKGEGVKFQIELPYAGETRIVQSALG